jgi:hypothetical protein
MRRVSGGNPFHEFSSMIDIHSIQNSFSQKKKALVVVSEMCYNRGIDWERDPAEALFDIVNKQNTRTHHGKKPSGRNKMRIV